MKYIAIGIVLSNQRNHFLCIQEQVDQSWGAIKTEYDPSKGAWAGAPNTALWVKARALGFPLESCNWQLILTLKTDQEEVMYFVTAFDFNNLPLEAKCKYEIVMLKKQRDLMPHLDWLVPLAADDGILKPLGVGGALDLLASGGSIETTA